MDAQRRILVFDQDEAVRVVAGEYLGSVGAVPLFANSPGRARACIQDEKLSGAFIDVAMPEGMFSPATASGLRVAGYARERGVPFVLTLPLGTEQNVADADAYASSAPRLWRTARVYASYGSKDRGFWERAYRTLVSDPATFRGRAAGQ